MFTLSKIIKVAPLSLIATLCFAASVAQAQSADLRVGPVPPEGSPDGYSYFGAQVAVHGRTAVVASPSAQKFNEDGSPIFVGIVHIHTTDINRTAWTLQTTLRAEDASPANQYFGVALALAEGQLVIATRSTLRFYEKTAQGVDLRDIVPLAAGEYVPMATPIDFANGVLAIQTTLDAGETVVRLFRVNANGKAKSLGVLQVPARSLSLDADGGALAIGTYGTGSGGRVFFYERQAGNWVLNDTLEQPNPQASGFGAGVALRGKRFLASAPGEGPGTPPWDTEEPYSGAVYAYHRENGQWVQVQRVGTDDMTQAAFGLHLFGAKIAAHGHHVLISAPSNGDGSIASSPKGPTTLFQWNASGLHSGRQTLQSSQEGGIDVSGRYLITGYPGWSYLAGYFDGSWVVDFADIEPGFSAEDSDDDEDTAP